MALFYEKQVTSYNLEEIKCGYLLWGRYRGWSEGKAGIVTAVTESSLTVQFHPGVGNITNHFVVPVSEVAAGQWEIRWSDDMLKVQELGLKTGDKPPAGETDEGRQDDTGRTDI